MVGDDELFMCTSFLRSMLRLKPSDRASTADLSPSPTIGQNVCPPPHIILSVVRIFTNTLEVSYTYLRSSCIHYYRAHVVQESEWCVPSTLAPSFRVVINACAAEHINFLYSPTCLRLFINATIIYSGVWSRQQGKLYRGKHIDQLHNELDIVR